MISQGALLTNHQARFLGRFMRHVTSNENTFVCWIAGVYSQAGGLLTIMFDSCFRHFVGCKSIIGSFGDQTTMRYFSAHKMGPTKHISGCPTIIQWVLESAYSSSTSFKVLLLVSFSLIRSLWLSWDLSSKAPHSDSSKCGLKAVLKNVSASRSL